ncbi:MAG: 7TM domain-containing protein [Candidatus Andersenbacteria bacterium]
MPKRMLLPAVFALAAVMLPLAPSLPALAQTAAPAAAATPGVAVAPAANAGEDRQVLIGQEVSFDAKTSTVPAGATPTYSWSFEDGGFVQGDTAKHIFRRSGDYTVTLTMVVSGTTLTDTATATVFERSVVLITDNATTADQIAGLRRQAEREDRLLVVLEDRSGGTDFVHEDNLTKLLSEKSEELRRADILVDWTTGTTGLNAISKFAQTFANLAELGFEAKAVVSLAQPVQITSRIAQSTFDVLRPKYILLTNDTALDAVLAAQSPDQVVDRVQKTGTSSTLIGTFSERAIKQLTPFNFMSFLVNYMVNKGVPVNTIVLILMLPIIATIFAFARQVVGLRAFGIYIPTIVTLSFLALGLTYGLTVFFVVLAVGTLARFFLRRARINYIPRLALVLTMVAFAILVLLAVGALTNQTTFVALSVFPILIMVALAEQFVSAQIEQGFGAAVLLTIETLILSIATFYLVSYDPFQSLILAYPELIFLTIPVNVLLGRWTGLRLTEYYRFRQVRRYAKLP